MRRILWLAAIGLTVGLSIPLIYGGRGLFHQLATFPLSLLGAGLAMIVLGWNFSAVRLRLMLHGIGQPMAYGRALAIIIATEFACCATPAGGGGPVAYVFLLKRHGASGTGAAALYALDILMDLLFFATALLAITLAILIQPDQLRVGWQLSLLACLLASAAVLAWGAAKHYRSVLLWGGRRLRWWRVSAVTRRRIARMVLRFRQGLQVAWGLSLRRLCALYALCIGQWIMRYSVLLVLVAGLHHPISWAYGFLMQMLMLSVGQLTMLPGGSGGVELSFTVLLAPVLDPATLGAVLILWRFTTYYWILLAGAPVFASLVGSALWLQPGHSAAEAAGEKVDHGIQVAPLATSTYSMDNVQVQGDVQVGGGVIRFAQGTRVLVGKGGSISFGKRKKAGF